MRKLSSVFKNKGQDKVISKNKIILVGHGIPAISGQIAQKGKDDRLSF